jgi:hypothetical protein
VPPQAYRTVFEIGFRFFPWSAFVHPAIILLVGIVLSVVSRHGLSRVVGLVAIALSGLIGLVLCVVLIPRFTSRRSDYLKGKTSIVEGTIENFHPMPRVGPSRESFSVSGVMFSYDVLDETPCFHDSPPHQGPIRQGQFVRIHYDNECIQRVDIRTDSLPDGRMGPTNQP